MRRLVIAALLAGQIPAAAPVGAADFAEARQQQAGAFAGLRLRVPLDGAERQRSIRAGLTLAPAMHSQTAAGEARIRIGEGFELGAIGREPLHLSIAGTPVDRTGPGGQRLGVSTLGWIAIGAGAAAVIVIGGAALVADHISDNERRGPDGS